MEDRLKSMSEAVRLTISNYPVGHRFHGNELHNDVAAIYPEAKNMYTDTLMRAMRRFCKSQYITVDHNNSLYEKVDVRAMIEEREVNLKIYELRTQSKKEEPPEIIPEPEPIQMELFPIYN